MRSVLVAFALVSLQVPWVHCLADCHRIVHVEGACPSVADVHGHDAGHDHGLQGAHDHAAHAQLERTVIASGPTLPTPAPAPVPDTVLATTPPVARPRVAAATPGARVPRDPLATRNAILLL